MNTNALHHTGAQGETAQAVQAGQPTQRISLGLMHVAKRLCGLVTAIAWFDGNATPKLAAQHAGWRARGDTVELIERFTGDDPLMWIDSNCPGICTECTRGRAAEQIQESLQ